MYQEDATPITFITHGTPDPLSGGWGFVSFRLHYLDETDRLLSYTDHPFDEFEITAQYHAPDDDDDDPRPHLYGFRFHYSGFMINDLQATEMQVKHLRRMQQALKRYEREWGSPATFALYAMTLLKACGVSHIYRADRNQPGTYSRPWRTHQLTDLPILIPFYVNADLRHEAHTRTHAHV